MSHLQLQSAHGNFLLKILAVFDDQGLGLTAGDE